MEGSGENAVRLGALVQRFRRQAGLTQQEVADRAGMSVGGLRDLEQGRVGRPRPATLRRLAAALRLPESAATELDRLRLRDAATPYGLRIQVLGPLTVAVNGNPVDPGSTRQCALLGLLAVRANTPVSLDALIEVVWGTQPPPAAAELIQSRMSRLRRRLGTSGRATSPTWSLDATKGGYQLTVSDEQVDLLPFRRLVEQGRRAGEAGDAAAAYACYQQAVALCRGEPLADVGVLRSHSAVTALDREWRRVVVEYADFAAALGQHDRVLPMLRQVTEADPLDEPAHARLIAALAAGGEPAAALAAYDRLRRRLADDLGVDPVPELQRLHQTILRGEPVSAATPARSPASPPAAPGAISPVLARLDVPAQLPIEAPGFTGRQAELARLDAALAAVGPDRTAVICVVSGTAGVGKTALAVRWGHRVRDRFPDGQLYFNLRGFGAAGGSNRQPGDPTGSAVSPEEAVRAFLDALAVPAARIPANPQAQAALYRTLLAGRRVLVVLDNARDAEQVRPLLPSTPGCLAVVTSRNPLTGLVAAEGAHPVPVSLLSVVEGRELLARRLGADRTAAEPDAVDEIVDRCAGLPLALAVVAARATVDLRQSLDAFATQLRDTVSRLDTLDAGDPATAVRATFSWSYHSLTAPAARLFRLLGLHPGPEVAPPVAATLAGVPVATVRALLAELARAHLVAEDVPGRYAFHDLLRAYAGELAYTVESEADRVAAVHRMTDHYLHTGYAASMLLDRHQEPVTPAPPLPGVVVVELADHRAALTWFSTEHRNLLAAVRQASGAGLDRHTWQLAHVVDMFLDRRGLWHDQVVAWQAALRAAERLADQNGQAEAHRRLGHADLRLGRHRDAEARLRSALDGFTGAGSRIGQAHTHRYLAHLADRKGERQQALAHARQALAHYQAAGHQRGQADALNGVGWHLTLLGDHAGAIRHCEQALPLLRGLGDRRGEAATWDSLGHAHHHLGQYGEAVECYQRAIALNRDLGDRYYEAVSLGHLGDSHRATGEHGAARDAWRRALEIHEALGHPDAEQVRGKLDEPYPS
ncbi:BTAD domain-containing putative transcriptional regulator [Plantactinospora mayteni]|uniref:SARP family transcriptional regulator n=1 Tax=Plantactinospora mayteni TaxID=566021 RepID=A0ABQ4EFZ4_9ACTN|nr:BTAD domain-containing putative transcriptional regulator [Plantactinospora mayteni]GIG93614.1 SARP family transcriptional regulator [Plantactinospora mayteni]